MQKRKSHFKNLLKAILIVAGIGVATIGFFYIAEKWPYVVLIPVIIALVCLVYCLLETK